MRKIACRRHSEEQVTAANGWKSERNEVDWVRCPWCGSPATVKGRRWECGWCGDCGSLPTPIEPEIEEPKPIKVSARLVYSVDVDQCWSELKTALTAVAGKRAAQIFPILGQVLLHEITLGIRRGAGTASKTKLSELRDFLQSTSELNVGFTPKEVIKKCSCKEVLYPAEGALSDRECGTFWTGLIDLLPRKCYFKGEPEGLSDLFFELSSACAYFSGGDMDDARKRRNELQEAFRLHWQKKAILQPDVERARALLVKGSFPKYEDPCRDILVSEYPEEVDGYSSFALDDLEWTDILNDVFDRNIRKAIAMWHRLLNAAAPCLSTSEKTAAMLLDELIDSRWRNAMEDERAEAFVTALEEDTFAKAVFQSAYVGQLQLELLRSCKKYGKTELGQRCVALLEDNPYPQKKWRVSLEVIRRALDGKSSPKRNRGPHTKSTVESVEDGTVYRYCHVRLPDINRSYAYRTEDLTIRVGDSVCVPFGARNTEMIATVVAVGDYLRSTAPYPPEHTKKILRVIPASPTLEQHQNDSANPTGDRTSESMNRSGQSWKKEETILHAPTEPAAKDTTVPEPAIRKNNSQRLVWTVLVIAVCAFVIALVWHQVENGYQQAEQYIMAGEVTAAANKLEKIPAFYKEQTLLSRYVQLCMLSEEGTASDQKESLDELEQILKESPVELRLAMRTQHDLILSRYKDLLYADALKWLDQKQYRAAQDALKQVREYPHVAELLRFVNAVEAAQSAHSSFLLKSLQTSFETIPLDYAGPQAEEIAAFRIELSTMIHSAELREAMERKAEEDRIAALKASGIPYVGMLEDEVNSTRQLGKAYRSGTNRERVKLSDGSYGQKEWQYYCWYSESDGDIVSRQNVREVLFSML